MSKVGIIAACLLIATGAAAMGFLPDLQLRPIVYSSTTPATQQVAEKKSVPVQVERVSVPKDGVKAIYMSQCYASMPKLRQKLIDIANTTEVNSIVVDIKDYTGTIAFTPENKSIRVGGKGCRVADMRALIKHMHESGIYVIGRITVFQDPYLADVHPEWAVKSRTRADGIWRDGKGLAFIDVGAQGYWDVMVALSIDSYAIGFDELNYDYVRFPSDGNMKDAKYSLSTHGPSGGTKADHLERFFQYLTKHVREKTKEKFGSSPVLSADLFGMTATNTDDLTIGQVLERTLPYFDAVAPMVYPSHYPRGFNGYDNPNKYPYGVIKYSMDKAVARAKSELTTVPGFMHTPVEGRKGIYKKESFPATKLRTWIQDFDYGGDYGPKEVRDQFKATYDAGLNSWMIWNASNRYTIEALKKE
ncbi:MAG: hypothetical protein RI911_452 [Candidatus Parcubacteria bacterium]